MEQKRKKKKRKNQQGGREEEEEEEAEGGGGGGLMAREELGPSLMCILANITTEPRRIRDFEGGGDGGGGGCPMLCSFSKVCFAATCVRLGILTPCASNGDFLSDGRA